MAFKEKEKKKTADGEDSKNMRVWTLIRLGLDKGMNGDLTTSGYKHLYVPEQREKQILQVIFFSFSFFFSFPQENDPPSHKEHNTSKQ